IRYGDRLNTDQVIKQKSKAFLEWAARYDDPDFDGRSITQHRRWIGQLSCEVLEIKGLQRNAKRMEMVLEKMATMR
ncbi:MAG: hypothetical protein AAFO94_21900, partial [Bacteroidota bacterium]